MTEELVQPEFEYAQPAEAEVAPTTDASIVSTDTVELEELLSDDVDDDDEDEDDEDDEDEDEDEEDDEEAA